MSKLWLASVIGLVMAGCTDKDRVFVMTGEAMGTTWRIKSTEHPDEQRRDIDSMLERLDQDLSTWRTDSWVSRFNRAKAGTTMEMPEDVTALMHLSMDYHQSTEGRFDPTIGALIRVWGFGAWRKDWLGEPDGESVQKARDSSGFRHIRIHGRHVTKLHDGLMLDFSAIAKGYAVDRMGDILRKGGHANYVIEFGGDLLAHGHAPGRNGWAVQGPEWAEPKTLINQAVATSGSEHQFRGERSHIIDPRSGSPAPVGRPASALAPTCAEADALATAKIVENSRHKP